MFGVKNNILGSKGASSSKYKICITNIGIFKRETFFVTCSQKIPYTISSDVKAAVLQNKQKLISYKYFNISLQIYIIVVRKFFTYFHFFALNTDNSLFCHRDIPTIHNAYCVSRLCKEKRCFTNDFVN